MSLKVLWSNVFSNFQEEINCFRQIECFFSAALFHDGRWRSWKVMGGEGDHEYLHLSHTSSFHRSKEKTLKMCLLTIENNATVQWNNGTEYSGAWLLQSVLEKIRIQDCNLFLPSLNNYSAKLVGYDQWTYIPPALLLEVIRVGRTGTSWVELVIYKVSWVLNIHIK